MKKTLLFLLVGALGASAVAAEATDDCAASFWFRSDAAPKDAPLGFGFSTVGWAPYPEGNLHFKVSTVPGAMGARTFVSAIEDACVTGAWHHAAFSYGLSKDEFRVWIDGRVQNFYRLRGTDPKPLDAAALKPPAKDAAALFGVKTWKSAPDETEMMTSPVPDGEVEASERDFLAAAKAAKNAAFAAVCRTAATRVKAFASGGDLRTYFRLQRFRRDLPKLLEWSEGAAESAAVLPVGIPRFSDMKHVPYRRPGDGRAMAALEIAAAQGEIDCGTFMALPYADVKAFDVRPSDLTGPDGAKIPASAVDVRVVSAWYETRWGWGNFMSGARDYPVRVPELLLHDDAMMKVDVATHLNKLRLSDPEGPRYVSVSDLQQAASAEPFDYQCEPVHDAASFVALPLEENEWRQFWITVRVPEDAAGGVYTGSLAFVADGQAAGFLPVKLTVHPFKLPRAATHYNIDRPMFGTWMHHCNLKTKLDGDKTTAGSHDLARSLRRLENEYRNMAEHNMINPWANCFDEYADWTIAIMKRAGCETRPFFGGIDISFKFAIQSIYPPTGKDGRPADISVEACFDSWQKEMTEYTNTVRQAMPEIEKRLGHRDVYSYAYDEGGDEFIRRDMPFMATLNTFGGKTFVTGGTPEGMAFVTDLNDGSGDPSAERSFHWHEGGSGLETYAAPHSGPENPDIWRRKKGLALWYHDLDGINEYVWYEGKHIWNEFLTGPGTEYRNFCIVYPTADGVVDTVAWEGQREGFDDIRYLTLLKRLARAAMRSGKAELVKAGREAGAWIELLDWRKGDLDALRLEAAGRIVALRKTLVAAGVDIEAVGGAVPVKPENVAIEIHAPKPGAKTLARAKELAKEGDDYAGRFMDDVSESFYRSAADAAKGEDAGFAADMLLKSADAALRRRDRAAAEKNLREVSELPGVASEIAVRAQLDRLMLPLSVCGYRRRADLKTVEKAHAALKALKPREAALLPVDRLAAAKLKIADAYRSAGDVTASAKVVGELMQAKGLSSGMRFGVLASAGETEYAARRYKQAADRFRDAAALDGKQRGRMLQREAESAEAAKDFVRAMDVYTQALKLIDKSEPAQLPAYNAMVGRIAEMSKLIRKGTKTKSADEVLDSSEDPLSLDE